MDRQGPPNQPHYQLARGLNRFRQRKRYYDVTQHSTRPAWLVETQVGFFCHLVAFSVMDRSMPSTLDCPLDRVLT